jgi:hypothetical protein
MAEPHDEYKQQQPATAQRGPSPKSWPPDINSEAGHQKTANQPDQGHFPRQKNAIQGKPPPDGAAKKKKMAIPPRPWRVVRRSLFLYVQSGHEGGGVMEYWEYWIL